MKKKILIVVLLFGFSFQFSMAQEKLKVISYNIFNGFDWGKDTVRRTHFQQWIMAQHPDVLAMQELCAYTPEKLKSESETWGHPYSALLKATGYSVGITSRFPIEVKEKILGGLHHGALHCRINGIDYLVVHLHPGSIKRRREEAQIL
jgi:exodeoxyribonuclease III